MNGSNSETLRSYQERVKEYIDGTAQEVTGAAKDWIDAALLGLPPQARIVELGSAFGRDAAYMGSQGFQIECTDAVPGFVSQLQSCGFKARLFNAITDELEDQYDLILANAVMLHFNRDEFSVVLNKLFRSLKHGGRFAFSLKRGHGESWSHEKIGAPRYFCYWQGADLAAPLRHAGFTDWTIAEAQTTRAHAQWLFVIASAPL